MPAASTHSELTAHCFSAYTTSPGETSQEWHVCSPAVNPMQMLHPLTQERSNSKVYGGLNHWSRIRSCPDHWFSSSFRGWVFTLLLNKSLTQGQTNVEGFLLCICMWEWEWGKWPESHRTLVFIWPRHHLEEGSGSVKQEVEMSFFPQPPSKLHEAPVLGSQTGTSSKL